MLSGFYNLYDNGALIMENVQAKEIKDFLGEDRLNVSGYATLGNTFRGRYNIEKVEDRMNADEALIKEWNEAIEPFKRVVWVKSGGRRLKLGGR